MWCTRWFLPLLLLPLPTAPAYFLVLFLFSLTLHAKPCFYCIVLLTTLFISSCYWQPFPVDSPLTVPWSDNITTFAEALNATLVPNYTKPLPLVMRAVDRCWCDFTAGGFFEPFNVSNWEYMSVQRLKNNLERQKTPEPITNRPRIDGRNTTGLQIPISDTEHIKSDAKTPSSTSSRTPAAKSWIWSRLRLIIEKPLSSMTNSSPLAFNKNSNAVAHRHEEAEPTRASIEMQPTISPSQVASSTRFPLLRQEYDLQPYGLGMVIDFRWSR